MNQNLTVLFVFLRTLRIIMPTNRYNYVSALKIHVSVKTGVTSYRRPDATVKMLISACCWTVTTSVLNASSFPLNIEKTLNILQ